VRLPAYHLYQAVAANCKCGNRVEFCQRSVKVSSQVATGSVSSEYRLRRRQLLQGFRVARRLRLVQRPLHRLLDRLHLRIRSRLSLAEDIGWAADGPMRSLDTRRHACTLGAFWLWRRANSTFLPCRRTAHRCVAKGWGRVVNRTSSASASPSPTSRWLYVATRWLRERLPCVGDRQAKTICDTGI